MNNPRRDAPSFHRNIEPITEKLREILALKCEYVLEVGSGSGQHVERFSREFPQITFQPTEHDVDNLPSIDGWCEDCKNVSTALQLDVTRIEWFKDDAQKFDALLCFNVIHITPWEVTSSIFKGAQNHMNDDCQLMFYGPFKIDGKNTSESNNEFEKWLKEKDASYGIRDIADVELTAHENGFKLVKAHPMPANNFILEFARA